MKRALPCGPVLILLGACRVDPAPSPPPPGDARREPPPMVAPGEPSGGQFYCRTDGGQLRALELRKLAVRVTTRPGTVRSHLTMEVAGPAGERVEAVMRLAVPRGAAVTSAILWVSGQPMNGAFVARDRAREIYRSIVERRRDPALVTWDGPGWVAVSIFPLERGEPRRFELEWVEPAGTEAGLVQYRVPTIVHGGRVIGRPSLEVNGRALVAAEGPVVALAPEAAGGASIIAGRAPGDPFHRRLVRTSTTAGTARVVILAETSVAMSATERVRQRAAIEVVLGALSATARVTLLAVDWDVVAVADHVDPAEAWRALGKLDGIASAGALHLERALSAGAARAHQMGAAAVLFVGRGIDSFGGDGVHGPLGQLRAAGFRLSVVATNEIPAPLADAAALTGGQTLHAAALDDQREALAEALRPRPAPPALAARDSDGWHALETITGQTVWLGRGIETAPEAPQDPPAVTASGEAADLVALWDRARLAWADRGARRAADHSPPAALTPLRALLVLESEQDYQRFGLAAPEPVVKQRPPEPQGTTGGGSAPQPTGSHDPASIFGRDSAVGRDADEVIGLLRGDLGHLGTVGALAPTGANGSGYGRGAGGLGGRRARAPEVIPGQARVRGFLDKEIIRRIIRRHINELTFCYEQELARRPGLDGRVAVQFTVAPSGQVIASTLQHSTVGNARVETCIVQAFRRWEFPRPLNGGMVIASCSFTLTVGQRTRSIPWDQVEQIDPTDDLDRSVWEGRAALAGKGPLARRVERVAALLELDRTSDPESLAWMIDRRRANGRDLTLVARLLVAADRRQAAVRVLSEGAPAAPAVIASELRRMGADADAAEVTALARRAR